MSDIKPHLLEVYSDVELRPGMRVGVKSHCLTAYNRPGSDRYEVVEILAMKNGRCRFLAVPVDSND